jgi:hypothetical protein
MATGTDWCKAGTEAGPPGGPCGHTGDALKA